MNRTATIWAGVEHTVLQQPSTGIGAGRDVRVNGTLSWVLLAFLTLAPLPLGGNRPPFVALTTMALAFIGCWYWSRLLRQRQLLRIGLLTFWPEAILFAALLAYLVVQLLPLSSLMPIAFTTPSGDLASPGLSIAPGVTALLCLQLAGYGLFTLLMVQVAARPERASAALDWLFGLAVGYAAVGLFMLTQWNDTWFGLPKEFYLGSATGPFINRNSFATFLAFGGAAGGALLTACLASHSRSRRISLRPAVILAGLLVIGIALMATNSRMGTFAAMLGGLVALVGGAVKARFGWKTWTLLLVSLAAAVVAVTPEFGVGLLERLLGVDYAAADRLQLYDQVLGMIARAPLTGYGGGTFEWAFPLFHAAPLSSEVVWDRAHSTYLTLWSELGLVAGSIPLLIVLLLAGRAARNVGRLDRGWAPGLAAVAVTVVTAVHSTVDFGLEMPANAYYLIAYLAIGGAPAWAGRGSR